MSLLLDALKKAEEAKRQAAAGKAGEGEAAPVPPVARVDLALEPVAPAPATPPQKAASGSPLPDLSAHLASVDADLAAIPNLHEPMRPTATTESRKPPQRPPVEAAAERAASQEAVRNAFAAKRTPPPNRTMLWVALGVSALAATGIGGWLWWQLNAVGSSSLAARPTATSPIGVPPQIAAPATGPVPAGAPTTPPGTTPLSAAPAEPRDDLPPAALPERSTERRTSPTPGTTAAATSAAENESPIRISRGELRVPPALARAYEQFQANDLAGARQSYEQVLKNDRKNIDALLGLAAIALRENNPAAAETLYLKVLEADPKDASAQAGLINLRGQADPSAAESRLKGLLATQPDSPTLNFALGNLYAGQRRWPEAQLAYFNAHTADPGNPDYLFNLAASLDQMHLTKIALDYYKGALTASTGRRPAFDPEQVRARIAELQR